MDYFDEEYTAVHNSTEKTIERLDKISVNAEVLAEAQNRLYAVVPLAKKGLEAIKQQVAANTYKATMLEMNSLVDSKIAQAKAETEQKSADNWNADLAVREMNASLEYTTDPDIAPIATAVLNRFIKQGDSVEKAIQNTNAFFASTAEKIGTPGISPSNAPGSTPFNQQQSNNNQQKATSHDEWLDVLAQ